MKENQDYVISRWFIPGAPYQFEDMLGSIPSTNISNDSTAEIFQGKNFKGKSEITYRHHFGQQGEHTVFLCGAIPDAQDRARAIPMENGWGGIRNKDGSMLVIRPRDVTTLWMQSSEQAA